MYRFVVEIIVFTLITMFCLSVFGQNWQDEEHVWDEEKQEWVVKNKAHGRVTNGEGDSKPARKKKNKRKDKTDFTIGSRSSDSNESDENKGNLKRQRYLQLKKAKKEYYERTGEPMPKSLQYIIKNGGRYPNTRHVPYCAAHRSGVYAASNIMVYPTLKEYMVSRGN
jgi:hypothetical protein